MKVLNTSNVSVLAVKVVVDLKAGTITADLSPTVWVGTGYDNITASISIKDRSGIVLTTKVLTEPETEQVAAELPKIDGIVKWGNYTGEVTLTDVAVYKDVNTRSVKPPCEDQTKNHGYIGISINPKCAQGKTLVLAGTPPSYQGVEASTYTELAKFYYPNGSGNEDLSGTFTPFYAKLVEGRNEATIESVGTYEFDNNFVIIVPYTGSASKNVVCISDLCAAYVALDLLYQRLDANCSPKEQETIVQKIDVAVEYMVMIEHGTACGYDVGDYVERLEKVLGINLSCGNIPAMALPSIPAENVIIEACNMDTEEVGFTRKFKIKNYTYIVRITNTDGTITQVNEETACERITNLTFNWSVVTDTIITYLQGSKNTVFLNIINTELSTEVDPKCVDTALNWRNASFSEKIQKLIDKMCDCCGEDETGPVMTLELDCESAEVTEEFLAGESGTGSIILPIQVTGAGTISASISGSGFSGTLGDTDVTEATENITIPLLYSGSGSAGARNATVTVLYPGNKTVTCVIPVVIDEVEGCSAPLTPTVSKASNTITIRFNPAVDEPDAYQVSRRLKSDPDSPAYYTVLSGTPTYNIGLGKYELTEDWTSAELNKVWIYKITSLCVSGARPFVTSEYIAQTCPTEITLNSTGTSVSYSFPHVGGQINQYRVAIYQGLTLIGSIQTKAVSPSPVTGSFTDLVPSTSYTVKVYSEITSTDYSLECTANISTSAGTGAFRVTQTAIPIVDEGLVTAVIGMPLVGSYTTIGYNEEYNGFHYAYEGVLGMTVTGSGWTMGASMRLYVNGGPVEDVSIYAAGTYYFSTYNFNATDSVWVEFLAFV